ncbi:oligosaccharide flippase family protein [bacterium]|nr:oligosaccharide flippase family protein [bacterium]
MTTSIRSLTKQTLVYGFGTIMTRLVTFLLLPVYTNVLSPADYGLAVLVFVFTAFMNHIYNYGLDSALMRHYGEDPDPTQKTRVLSTAIWMALGSSLLFSGIIFVLNKPLSQLLLPSVDYAILIKFAAAILFFDCIGRVPFALLRLEEKPMLFMGVRLINVIVTLALNIYFVVFLKTGIIGIFQSNVIASCLTAAILFAIVVSKVKITISGNVAKDLMLFGLPFVPVGLATAAMEMLNRYIVQHFMGLDAVGIFSAGYKLGIFMLLISTAFYYAWQPFFIKAGKRESSRALFSRVLTYFVLVALSFWVVLTVFMHEIINFQVGSVYLIGPEFQGCESMVPFVLLGYVFFGINQVFLPGIYFEKKTRYLAYITLVAAGANILFNFLLIPILGLVGSAISSAIGYIVLAVSTLTVSQRLFKVPYEYKRIILLFIVSLTAGFISYSLDLSIVIRIMIVVLLPIILRLLGFFKKEELASLKVLLPFR